jgi:hypothetical protein
MKTKGQCLCGKVEFTISNEIKTFDSCHCSMCRRWSGGPALSVEANPEFVKVYNSSEWAERGFCNNCGSHLFYRLKDGSYSNVPLGLLENQSDYKFTSQIYIDHKPTCYSFSNETMMMTEADVLKSYGVT